MDLMAINPPDELPTNLSAAPGDGLEGLAGLVLFYPYCGFPNRAAKGWPRRVPTFFVLAGADTIVSTDECQGVAERLKADGHDVQIQVYEDLDHAFDEEDHGPGRRLVYDEAATLDAQRRVAEFLGSVFR